MAFKGRRSGFHFWGNVWFWSPLIHSLCAFVPFPLSRCFVGPTIAFGWTVKQILGFSAGIEDFVGEKPESQRLNEYLSFFVCYPTMQWPHSKNEVYKTFAVSHIRRTFKDYPLLLFLLYFSLVLVCWSSEHFLVDLHQIDIILFAKRKGTFPVYFPIPQVTSTHWVPSNHSSSSTLYWKNKEVKDITLVILSWLPQ